MPTKSTALVILLAVAAAVIATTGIWLARKPISDPRYIRALATACAGLLVAIIVLLLTGFQP